MKPILIYIILATFFAVGSINPSMAQTPEQLYQKGLGKEEGEGALQDAINLYNQIADNSNADKSLQAKALLHIGMCYEKLGMKEATKAYQRLVNNFPAQKNEVAIARERLSRLIQIADKVSETPLTPKFTKIKIPTKLSWSVRLSPDGKTLALVSEEKLWKMPLSGNIGPDFPGAPVHLNTDGIEVEYTDLSWSTDGKWIAFNDPGKSGPNQSIYIVPSKGGKPEKIIENFRDARIVNYRISLSPDGEKLAFSSVEENKQHIFTISTKVGNTIQLTDMQAREPAFSPDGKMIAYVEDKNLGAGQGGLGLWIIPAIGGTPQLLADAGTASSPVWSPDGDFIAFLDYSQGGHFYSKQINIVPVLKDGKTPGKVTMIDVPKGTGEVRMLAGWTPDNKIGALCMTKQEFALYTLPAKGGQAAMVLHDCYALQPRWSSDGKQIFYVTPPKEGDNKFYRLTLASVSASGGIGKPILKEHEGKVIGQLPYQSGNRISPDGKMIISSAYTSSDTMGLSDWPNSKIWEISIDGKESKQITNQEGRFADMCPSWSPDGKKIAFIRAGLKDNLLVFDKVSIYIISSSGGEPKMIIPETDKYIFSPVWSPDGKMIAYLTKDKEPTNETPNTRYMNVVNVENGEVRVVGEVTNANVNIELAWSPDSKRVAFNGDNVIKVMNVNDGKTEDIKTNLVDVEIWHLDWSRDGEQFVFSGMTGGKDEFWFLEDFLPLEKLAQKSQAIDISSRALTNKKIWEGQDVDDSGEISPDGKYLSYVDWNTSELALYEIITGEKHRLTHNNSGENYNQFVFSPKWSPDSRQIFNTAFVTPELSELRTIGIKDSKPNTIYKVEGKGKWLEVHDISKDGRTILATIEINGKTSQIVIVSVHDRNSRIIKELPSVCAENLKFTNDEASIIYDYPPDLDSPNHDIYLLSIDGKMETSLVKHPAHDFVLGLSPEGDQLLFASSRSGKLDFWCVGLKNGKIVGNPKQIKASDYSYLKGLGFSDDGSFYYCHFPSKTDIYETEINPETGKIITPPIEVVGNFIGENSAPDYSSDGKYLAFISRRSPFNARETFRPRGNVLCIKSLENGTVREIKPEITNFGFPKWSPDNRSIMVVNWEANNKMEIYGIDVQTSKISLIVSDENQKIHHHEWSADGKSVFLVRDGGNDILKLVKHEINTGKESVLTSGSWRELYTLSVSPDGKWLAFMGLDNQRSLKVLPSSGGEVREIHTWYQGDNRSIRHCWSADGKYIYLQKLREPKSDLIWNLWQIPVEGGEPKNLGLEMTDIWQISAHPDGRHIVFSNQGSSYKLPEVWMIENFLPKEETGNK